MSNNVKRIEEETIITTEKYDPNKDYRKETTIVTYSEFIWTRLFRKIFNLPSKKKLEINIKGDVDINDIKVKYK